MAVALTDIARVRVYRPVNCTEFVTRHGFVPSGAARGRLSFSDRPYQRGLYEAIDAEGVEEVAAVWCSQSGKSTGLLNVLQWHNVTRPSNSMVAFPNDRSRNDFVDDRLRPAIQACEQWRSQLARVPDNIIQSKVRFQGKALYLALLGSEADLAQRDCELVAIDEADKQPSSTGKEGTPEKQIAARTRTFRRAKRLNIGTPTLKDSPLDRAWKRSNQMRWTVCCPECGREFFWTFHDLKWGERPTDSAGRKRSCLQHADAIDNGEVPVWYEPPCGHRIEGRSNKDRVNRGGRWVALRPEAARTIGLRVTAFDIPDESLETIAAEFLRAKHDEEGGDERGMQHFWNHWLAETFHPRRQTVGEDAIISRVVRVEAGEVPRGFDFVTVGADVQDNRIYWIATAWRPDPLACHVVDFGCVRFGDGDDGEGADLNRMLSSNLREFSDVAALRVWRGPAFEGRARAVGIDSGDGEHRTPIYRWCLGTGRHCRPTKGERSPFPGGKLIRLSDNEKDDHRGRLVLLCPVALSDQIGAWYKMASPDTPGARAGLTFCQKALEDKEFQAQLVSMEKTKGRWELRDGHAQDHYWDAFRGAIAMGAVCGVFRAKERKPGRRPIVRRPTLDPFGRR